MTILSRLALFVSLAAAPLGAQCGTYARFSPVPGGRSCVPTSDGHTLTSISAPGVPTISGPAAPSSPNKLQISVTDLTLWSQQNLASVTEGQTDETGGSQAALVIGNTTATGHGLQQNPLVPAGTQFTFSVYAKPSGYNYANLGFRDEAASGNWRDNFFNVSTCATATIGAGVSASVSAGGGWCRIIVTFTAVGTVSVAYLNTAAADNTCCAAQNGTSGVYFSHPSITYTSSVQPFADFPRTIHYCQAAYDAAGRTTGCGPWATANTITANLSIGNSVTITPPAVSGAANCKVFRYDTSGYSSGNGALPVNGSTTIPCGTVVTDTGLTADGTTPTYGLRDTRLQHVATLKNVPTNLGGSYTLLSLPRGSAGTITRIRFSINASADATNVVTNGTLQINCGGTVQTVDVGLYLLTLGAPKEFINNTVGVTRMASNYTVNSEQRQTEINFTNGCSITWISPDLQNTTSGTIGWYGDVQYRVGPNLSGDGRTNWHGTCTSTLTNVAQYASYDVLPQVTSATGGELESVSVYVASPSNQAYEEGEPTVTADGSVVLTANGQEDFHGCSYYCQAQVPPSDRWGIITGTLFQTAGASDSMMYRFFSVLPDENVLFNSTLRLTYTNGVSGQGSPPGTVTYRSCATYWTH